MFTFVDCWYNIKTMIYEPKEKEYSMAGRKRNKGKSIILLVMLVFHLFIAAGCTTYDNFSEAFLSEGTGEDTVRIGIFQPLSGSDEEAGRLEVTGIELAHKLYPKVLGKEVELVYADNRKSGWQKRRQSNSSTKKLISYWAVTATLFPWPEENTFTRP